MKFEDPKENEIVQGISTDLSSVNYLVGIVDPETELGVSDTEFDDTTELEVEEESVNSEMFEGMVEEDSIPVAAYDVEVEGSRDEETAVSFVAPEGFMDGDKVTIVHKRHDGSNEIFEKEVLHGRITIETDEFSPFLVQVDKDHEHRYTSEKVVTKGTFSKSVTVLKKCYACDETSGTVKIKPAKVSLSKSSFEYTGKYISKSKLPKVIVKDGNGDVIPSKDYSVKKPVAVNKMKNIGRYPYKITFKETCEKYSGTKTVYLEIVPKASNIVSVKRAKKAFTVKWTQRNSTQASGYQVMVATNSNFTQNTKTINVKGYKKNSLKVGKLKAKKKYYVKVRPYKTVKGVKIYAKWCKAKSVTTK